GPGNPPAVSGPDSGSSHGAPRPGPNTGSGSAPPALPQGQHRSSDSQQYSVAAVSAEYRSSLNESVAPQAGGGLDQSQRLQSTTDTANAANSKADQALEKANNPAPARDTRTETTRIEAS